MTRNVASVQNSTDEGSPPTERSSRVWREWEERRIGRWMGAGRCGRKVESAVLVLEDRCSLDRWVVSEV